MHLLRSSGTALAAPQGRTRPTVRVLAMKMGWVRGRFAQGALHAELPPADSSTPHVLYGRALDPSVWGLPNPFKTQI